MPPLRLTPAALRDHLILETTPVARLVRLLRKTILTAVPGASEAIRFGSLCYFHPDADFGSIGGNICMIQVSDGPCPRGGPPARSVSLAFIHGVRLPDPEGLLRGRTKAKRFLPVPDAAAATGPALVALVVAARDLRPWE